MLFLRERRGKKMFRNILVSFIPILVAVDAIGALPIFASLTEGLVQEEGTRIIIQSMIRKGIIDFLNG